MSFSVSNSTSSSLTFGPSRLDILWDGVSNGKVTILPVCTQTTPTASYTVHVLHVFESNATKTIYSSGNTLSYSAVAGEPFKNSDSPNHKTAAPFVIGSTLSTASNDVSFELIPSNTNYTSSFDAVAYATSQSAHYRWELRQSRGTASQTVACGRLSRIPPNPFASSGVYGSLVASRTASFCIG